MIAFIANIGTPGMLIILAIVLILFGAGKLPQVLESFGKGLKSFRDAQRDDALDVTPGKQVTDSKDSEPAS